MAKDFKTHRNVRHHMKVTTKTSEYISVEQYLFKRFVLHSKMLQKNMIRTYFNHIHTPLFRVVKLSKMYKL